MCLKSRRWWAQHARHFHLYEVTGNLVRPDPLLTQSILKISESVTWWKVSDRCLSRREAKYPPSSTGRRPSGPNNAALRRTVWFGRRVWFFDCKSKSTILLSAPESIPVFWSLFYTCKVQNSISLGCCKFFKKRWWNKRTFSKLFFRMKETLRTMLSGSVQNHAWP